jgi:hypothetical protein
MNKNEQIASCNIAHIYAEVLRERNSSWLNYRTQKVPDPKAGLGLEQACQVLSIGEAAS